MLRSALASLAFVLAACASKPPPPPVCPAPPKMATPEDMERIQEAMMECIGERGCRDKVLADYDGYVLSVRGLFGDDEPPAKDSAAGEKALADLLVIEERACACADAACGERIQKEFEAWEVANSDVKGSQAQADKAGKVAERMSECMAKVMPGGDDESELED